MNGNDGTAGRRDSFLDSVAADLTAAAYGVALRHGTGGRWLDLELDLWRALDGTVREWGRGWPRPERSGAPEGWQEGFLAELTDAAYRTTRRYGVPAPVPEAEPGLYQAFRSAIGARLSCLPRSGASCSYPLLQAE